MCTNCLSSTITLSLLSRLRLSIGDCLLVRTDPVCFHMDDCAAGNCFHINGISLCVQFRYVQSC